MSNAPVFFSTNQGVTAMNLFPRRDTQALAALRDGYIELGTRVILMEALLEDTRKRVPYRTEKVRMKQAVERGV